MEPNFIKIEHQIDELLKEIKELKGNQKVMSEKMDKMQQVIDNIESDIYIDEDCDNELEIICPYCDYEFFIDIDEDKKEVECPKCKNTIELDWTGDLDDDNGCSGHCHGCSGCED